MALISKARTVFGAFLQVIGIILWIGCGLVMVIWELYVLFSTFGIWTIFLGLLFLPITYVASIFIIWFVSGAFPFFLLVPYILSWIGIVIAGVGGAMKGDDDNKIFIQFSICFVF